MNLSISFLAATLLPTALAPMTAAQTSAPPSTQLPQLWTVDAELPLQAIPADSVEERVLAVDLGDLGWATAAERQRVVLVQLFDQEVLTLELERRSQPRPGGALWYGQWDGTSDHLVLAIQGDAAAGSVRLGEALYRLRTLPGGDHVLTLINEGLFKGCGTDEHPAGVQAGQGATQGQGRSPQAGGGNVLKAASSLNTFDVIVAYTQSAKSSAGGSNGILALIDVAIFETNQSFQNGFAGSALRLVNAGEVSYSESGDMGSDLSRFKNKNDGHMDEVHGWRTQYGADAMTLLVNGGQYCGVGYLMTNVTNNFKSQAFNVTARSCATGYLTFGHELGHNFGCAHDRDNAGSASKSYAYGYRTPNNQYRSVMAYSPGSRVPTFSSPLSSWNGFVMGVENSEDNGRAISTNGTTIAGWYPTQVAITDCNDNSVDDEIEIAFGLSSDADGDGLLDECTSLSVDVSSIPILPGGTQNLTLSAGSEHAGRLYLMLATLSGVTPGLQLDEVLLPLNPDAYTNIALAGDSLLSHIVGTLDAEGQGSVSFDLPPFTAPLAAITLEVHHAFLVFGQTGLPVFASTPVRLTFGVL